MQATMPLAFSLEVFLWAALGGQEHRALLWNECFTLFMLPKTMSPQAALLLAWETACSRNPASSSFLDGKSVSPSVAQFLLSPLRVWDLIVWPMTSPFVLYTVLCPHRPPSALIQHSKFKKLKNAYWDLNCFYLFLSLILQPTRHWE